MASSGSSGSVDTEEYYLVASELEVEQPQQAAPVSEVEQPPQQVAPMPQQPTAKDKGKRKARGSDPAKTEIKEKSVGRSSSSRKTGRRADY